MSARLHAVALVVSLTALAPTVAPAAPVMVFTYAFSGRFVELENLTPTQPLPEGFLVEGNDVLGEAIEGTITIDKRSPEFAHEFVDWSSYSDVEISLTLTTHTLRPGFWQHTTWIEASNPVAGRDRLWLLQHFQRNDAEFPQRAASIYWSFSDPTGQRLSTAILPTTLAFGPATSATLTLFYSDQSQPMHRESRLVAHLTRFDLVEDVPEPTTVGLLALGLVTAGLRRLARFA